MCLSQNRLEIYNYTYLVTKKHLLQIAHRDIKLSCNLMSHDHTVAVGLPGHWRTGGGCTQFYILYKPIVPNNKVILNFSRITVFECTMHAFMIKLHMHCNLYNTTSPLGLITIPHTRVTRESTQEYKLLTVRHHEFQSCDHSPYANSCWWSIGTKPLSPTVFEIVVQNKC